MNKKIIILILIFLITIIGRGFWHLNKFEIIAAQEMILKTEKTTLENSNFPLSVSNPFGVLGGGCGADAENCNTPQQINSRIRAIKELGVGFIHLLFNFVADVDESLKEPLHKQGLSLMRVTRGLIWQKYSKNPVMPSGPEDAWNKLKTDPTVLKDGDIYKMWFNTSDKEGEYTKLAYAESKDGINWEFYPKPVLEPGYDDSWEGTDVETPTVIKDDQSPQEERYKMWYAGWVKKKGDISHRLCYLTGRHQLDQI